MSDDAFVLRADGPVVGSEPAEGAPLYETANRNQVELTPTDLESLLPPGHAARLVWRFVDGLDLSRFYGAIGSREGVGGRPAIDPKILVALWLYATIDGVGSAREVDRLCYSHDAYRWIRGGVSVNYHTLSDFRVRQQAALDDLLTQSITALLRRRLITLRRVAQDGTRLRANAGVRSFRRAQTLRECLAQAQRQVALTARDAEGRGLSRDAAASARAAAEQLARVAEALAELPAITAAKTRNRSTSEPRASTTDAEARVMKMADGGYRPAYNVQFACDADSDAVVGVAVTNVGSDQPELLPMLDQIETRTGRLPDQMLVDRGYATQHALTEATTRGVEVLAPALRRRGRPDPLPPQPHDSMAMALWRARMTTLAAQQQYRQRAGIAERLHADIRTHRMGPPTVPVRGLYKVHTWALWVALAVNAMRAMQIVPHVMT
jgi:transposase